MKHWLSEDYRKEFKKKKKKKNLKAKTSRTNKPGVSGDSFLKSYAWRKVRMEALVKYGSKCMCCGATPHDGIVINVDHIKPRKTHPELALSIDNLQVLCHVCNHGKGNWDDTDWRSHMNSIRDEG